MLCVCVRTKGHSGDGCDLVSTLCTNLYGLRKNHLFVLSWGRVRRVKYLFRTANVWWTSVHSLLLLLVARCLETIGECI